MNNNGIWSMETAIKRHRTDLFLAAAIAKMFKPKLVADIGCGFGFYCRMLKGYGWEVHGYEGTQGVKDVGIYDDILTVDLTKVRYVEVDYDLAICLEVGEHIPKEYEQTVLDNICRYSRKNLVLSWAIPGQGGAGHHNERDNKYIIDEVVKRGFKFDKGKSKVLRAASTFKWFKNTIMVFK